MTDGIIQEVIASYILLRTFSNEFKDNPKIDQLLDNLQQELIEKIKQKRVWQWDTVRLRDLIGDNE